MGVRLERAVGRWADGVARRPRLILAAALALAGASAWLAATRLEVDTDQDKLVSSEADYFVRFKHDYLGNFPETEYAWVGIAVDGQPARALAFAEDLCRRLADVEGVVFARHAVDLAALRAFPLHLASDDEVAEARARLLAARDDLRQLVRARDLGDLLATIVERTSELALQARDPEPGDHVAFAFLDGLLADAERALAGEEPTGEGAGALLPGARASTVVPFFDSDPRTDPDGQQARFLMIAINCERDFGTLAVIEAPLRRIRAALDEARAAHPGVDAGLTGRPVLSADELLSTNRDMTIATSIAFCGVALMYMLAFRSVWRPLLVMGSLGVGIAWTYGFLTVAIGSLNLLSLVFTIILIGLGGDFGIHLLARHLEARGRGLGPAEAVREAMITTGPGNLIAAGTSAAAFFSSLLVDFQGLAELGLIAGAGVLLCVLSMLTTLPAALLALEPAQARVRPPVSYRFLGRLDRLGRPLAVVGVAVTALLAVPGRGLRLDTALLDLHDPTLESVRWERRLSHESAWSSWFAVFLAPDLDAARALTERLRARPDLFARVEGPLDLLPPPGRQAALEALAADLGPLTTTDTRALGETEAEAAADRARLAGTTRELEGLLQRLTAAARGGAGAEEVAAVEALTARAGRLAAALERPAPADDPGWRALSAWQRALLDGLKEVLAALARPGELTLDAVPPEVKERLVGKDGQLALMAYPRADLWDPANLDVFHDEIVAIDPQVTGVPVMVQRSIDAMRRGFIVALGYAVLVVVALVLLDVRSPLLAFLALLPTVVSLAWAAGLAVLCDVHLNLANFYAVPILVGIGVDSGVHLVHRWREAPLENPAAGPTGAAVSLTSGTTLIGFGSLVFAAHAGLASFGAFLAIGTACGLVASLVLLPPALVALGRRRAGAAAGE
ncbi:MAG: MMPL family transporter [Planctomycetes bacterium]|nr:MMPL family transporter [Planctomycetota bacterium]